MLLTTRRRIDGHWSRRFGAPVPGLVPVTVAPTGRYSDAALVLLLGDHAYVDPPLPDVDRVVGVTLAHPPGRLLDPASWLGLATGPVLGPSDHFWADHDVLLPPGAGPVDPRALEQLRGVVPEAEWLEGGFDRPALASFGVVEGGRLVAASVLTSLWGWPVDVGVLVAPAARGRGLGRAVAASALSAGVSRAGFAAFRAPRTPGPARGIAARLGLEAYGANLVVPLEH